MIKLVISVAMLTLILSVVDLNLLIGTFREIPLFNIAVVVVGYALGQMISAYKWLYIARQGGIESDYPKALKAYFIGMFVNSFGFGIVGGDLTRSLLLVGKQPKKTEAFTSVAADRFHGLATLALLGVISTTIWGTVASYDPIFVYLLWFISASIVLGWFLGPPIVMKLTPKTFRFREKIETLVKVFPSKPLAVLWITVVSASFHLLQIGMHWAMADGVGANIPFALFLVVIPFVNILSSLPISWNGLGVRENAYAFFLVPAFLTAEQAIAFGAIWLIGVFCSSGIGGLVAFLSGDLVKLEQREQAGKTKRLRPASQSV